MGGGQLRFQATDLGSYLLYTSSAQFISDAAAVSSRRQHSEPRCRLGRRGRERGSVHAFPKSAPDRLMAAGEAASPWCPRGCWRRDPVHLHPGERLRRLSEAELNATGTPGPRRYPYGQVRGLMDGHMHWVNFEYLGGNFHCGRPWSPYGIPSALRIVRASRTSGRGGAYAETSSTTATRSRHTTPGLAAADGLGPQQPDLRGETTTAGSSGSGWRAERLMVMPVNETGPSASSRRTTRNPCDEMATARLELGRHPQAPGLRGCAGGSPARASSR